MNTKFEKVCAAFVAALATALALGSAGCTQTEVTNTVTVTDEVEDGSGTMGGSGDEGSLGSSEWSLSRGRDAITDEQTTKAVASFSSGEFRIEVTISCGSRSLTRYEFSAFDRNGDAEPLRWRENGAGLVDAVVPYDLRMDGGKALSRLGMGRRYNNVFSIGGDIMSADYAASMAKANSVIIRFEMVNGDATVEFDQSDPQLKRVLGPCLRTGAPSDSAPGSQSDQSGRRAATQPTGGSASEDDVPAEVNTGE